MAAAESSLPGAGELGPIDRGATAGGSPGRYVVFLTMLQSLDPRGAPVVHYLLFGNCILNSLTGKLGQNKPRQKSAEQMTKATLGPHAGVVLNRMTFAEACVHVRANPHTTYQTTGDQTPFTARAVITSSGNHRGQEALRLAPHNEYIYECCWGHKTNCAGSHIDCYSAAICKK